MVIVKKVACRSLAGLAAVVLLAGGAASVATGARPPAPRLLPPNTVALLSIVDVPELSKRFMNTAMGRMSQDPQLRPLVGELYASLAEATSELKERIGLSLPELLAVPQGELTLALVAPEETAPAVVLLLDAGESLSNARTLLQRVTAELQGRPGVSRSEQSVAGTKLVIYDGLGPRRRRAAYFERDATIVVGSDPDVLKQLLAAWDDDSAETLAENPDFAAVVHHCRGPRDETPQLVAYADPVGIMRSVGNVNAGVQLAVTMLPPLGLDGVRAVGLSWILDTEQFDSIVHAHLRLHKTRSGVIKMIALESGEIEPEGWVPADAASYTTLHWDFEETYAALTKLYDSFRGDGAMASALRQGLWERADIDFHDEVLQSLDGRVTVVSWIERPATLRSQAMLVGLKLEHPDTMQKALEKLVKLGREELARETYAGRTYYRVSPPQIAELPPDQRPPLPCFGILDDYLLVANRQALYREALLAAADGSKSLGRELDFKLIAGKIRRQCGGREPALISFTRPEEHVRFLYDLATAERSRTRLRERAEDNPFFRSLNAALEQHPLPPFAVIRRYLAPSGAMVIDDETDIHYTDFTLRRKLD